MEKRESVIKTGEIKKYLKKYNPLNLSGASVELINAHNHLNYRLEKGKKIYCLRMINPQTCRAGEWIDMPEEYVILKYLEKSGLGPKAYFVDPERFSQPLMIQEFISAACFKNLTLTEEHLIKTAQAIAVLNSQKITPDNFPFRRGYSRYSYLTSVKTWRCRLSVIKRSNQKDVLDWAEKIERIIDQAKKILEEFEPLLRKSQFAFNFDGAHTGNTYWTKDHRVIFLDWQKVSHGDPAFTLVRFLTSIRKAGEINPDEKETLIGSYLEKRAVSDFRQLFDQRLFERLVADLVWVLWHYVQEEKSEPIEKTLDIAKRYTSVKEMMEQY